MLILLTLLNAAMGLNQEGKASASVSALQKMMVVKAKVRRGGELGEVAMDQLVPGDIVNIEAGDLVPADARILTAATLEIDESALTGESVPVPKQVDPVAADSALGDRDRHGVHEHPGHARRGHDPRHHDRHGDRGRPHQRHAPGHRTRKTPLTRQLDALTNQILVIAGVALLAVHRDRLLQERPDAGHCS